MNAIKGSFIKLICILGLLISIAVILMAGKKIISFGVSKTCVDVVFLGDSIFGNFRDETSIPNMFKSKTSGLSTVNLGLGGTTAGICCNEPRSEVILDSLSLVGIVDAIDCGDYSLQRSAIPSRVANGDLTYFPEVIDEFEAVNWSNVRIIIVEHGLNDYFNDWPVGQTSYEEYDLNTYYGAVSYSIEVLKEQCPNAYIVLASPVYGGDNLSNYAAMAARIADEQNILFFDAYNKNIVTADNVDIVTEDGIHLNEIGREAYTVALYDFCKDEGLFD